MLERYLRYAIAPDAPPIRSARLVHDGFIRTKPGGRWFPIQGSQNFRVTQPDFDWKGIVRPFPLIRIEAHDSLHEGRGNMIVKLNSIFTIADVKGAEIDQSAAARWLMEGVWFPVMFASDLVQWTGSLVRLLQPGLPVTADARFDAEGRIVGFECNRFRDIGGGKVEMSRWKAECSDYRQFGAFRVPTTVTGTWVLASGNFDCIEFRVQSIEYE